MLSPRRLRSSLYRARITAAVLLLMDPLEGCGGAPPPAVDPISRAGYLSCPNDNAVHDRSGHPGGYHNPGWKNAERSGGGRRCLNRLRGHPLDNTVIAIDTRTGAQTVISAEGGTHAVTVDPARHTVVASNTAAGTASVIERRRLFRYADLCRRLIWGR
jgi:DNA-binding beta-propeller fold protein YncE